MLSRETPVWSAPERLGVTRGVGWRWTLKVRVGVRAFAIRAGASPPLPSEGWPRPADRRLHLSFPPPPPPDLLVVAVDAGGRDSEVSWFVLLPDKHPGGWLLQLYDSLIQAVCCWIYVIMYYKIWRCSVDKILLFKRPCFLCSNECDQCCSMKCETPCLLERL